MMRRAPGHATDEFLTDLSGVVRSAHRYTWGVVRILVVEDEQKVAKALRDGLEAERYDVRVASTGEEGFFLGAYVINYGITAACLLAVMAGLIVRLATDPQASIVPFLAAGAAVAILVPLASYPFGKTVWAAIDLIMRPLDAAEEADALLAHQERAGD